MRSLTTFLALLLVTLTGCASLDSGEGRILQSWKGAHIDQVFRNWGLPHRQAKLSDGNTMYEWGSSQSYTMPGRTTGTVDVIGNTAYIAAQTTGPSIISGECTRTLIATQEGTVIEGGARGNNCCVMAIAGYCASLLNPSVK
jgi:hypothetical protein